VIQVLATVTASSAAGDAPCSKRVLLWVSVGFETLQRALFAASRALKHECWVIPCEMCLPGSLLAPACWQCYLQVPSLLMLPCCGQAVSFWPFFRIHNDSSSSGCSLRQARSSDCGANGTCAQMAWQGVINHF
jgi:hypothetical protein